MVLFLISLGSVSSAQNTKKLLIGWDPWEPYQYEDNNGNVTGLDIDLVSAILKNMNYFVSFTFEKMPWKRHLNEVEKGTVDIALGACKIAEREEYAYFSKPYRPESVVLYIRKEDINKYSFTNLSDIIGTSFNLGVTRGYYYGEDFDKLINNPDFIKQIYENTFEEHNYKMLIANRIDGFLSDPVTATAGLKKEGVLDQVAILIPVYADDVYIMFSKKTISPQFVAAFNSSLDELKTNGSFDKILTEYLK